MSYIVRVTCDNCGVEGNLEIPKGTLVKDMECLICGNRTLTKGMFTKGWVVTEGKADSPITAKKQL